MTIDEVERWLVHAIAGVYHRDAPGAGYRRRSWPGSAASWAMIRRRDAVNLSQFPIHGDS